MITFIIMIICSIIIASYNEATNLEKCLTSVKEISYDPSSYEIIVIDNNSSDNTLELMASRFPEILCLQEKKPGASFARNTGIEKAQGDIVVFLDADTQADVNWLTYLLKPFDNNEIGAVGGEVRPMAKGNIISEYLGISLLMRYHRYGKERQMKGYPSCNLAIRKELLQGGFDTSSFTTYGEDKDLCYKVTSSGKKLIFQPGAIIYHDHPKDFSSLVKLFIGGSHGRLCLSANHPKSMDILLLDLHAPLLYFLALLLALLNNNIPFLILLILPALTFLLAGSIIAYKESKNAFLSFLVKPVLDVFSIVITYFFYSLFKLKQIPLKKISEE